MPSAVLSGTDCSANHPTVISRGCSGPLLLQRLNHRHCFSRCTPSCGSTSSKNASAASLNCHAVDSDRQLGQYGDQRGMRMPRPDSAIDIIIKRLHAFASNIASFIRSFTIAPRFSATSSAARQSLLQPGITDRPFSPALATNGRYRPLHSALGGFAVTWPLHLRAQLSLS